MELESGMSIVFLVQPPRPQFKNLICFLLISSAFGRGGVYPQGRTRANNRHR